MKKAVLFKIKEGKKEVWYAWCLELATVLREEALNTLAEEGVVHELTLGFSIDKDDYCIGYMDGDNLPANLSREINKKHEQMKESCLERIGEVDVLYDLKGFL